MPDLTIPYLKHFFVLLGNVRLYRTATQLANRGPNPDLSSIETGPQAPE